MKPKIGTQIWVIYGDQILSEIVGYLGKESFVVEYYESLYNTEHRYDNYNKTWWLDLEKAKQEMRRRFGNDIKFNEFEKGAWEVL